MEIRLVSGSALKASAGLNALMHGKNNVLRAKDLPSVIFADLSGSTKLGYFDSLQNLIVLDEQLCGAAMEKEREAVFLHELAHFLNYKESGLLDHGPGFRNCCMRLGVPNGYEKARIKRDGEKRKSILSKIEKLISLSSSPFKEEGASALKKAQELMAGYNISPEEEKERLYAVTVLAKNRFFYHEKMLMQAVQMLSGALNVIEKKRNAANEAIFYGNFNQVEFAMYLWQILNEEIEKCAASTIGKQAFDRFSFYNGLASGLLARVRENTSDNTCKALAFSFSETKRKYGEITGTNLHCRSFHATIRDAGSFNRGRDAASAIAIPDCKKARTEAKRIGFGGKP